MADGSVKTQCEKHKPERALRRFMRVSAIAVAAMLAFTACGCGGGASSGGGGNSPVSLATSAPTTEPSSGGALRLAMPVNASYDNPLIVNTEEMSYLFSLVFDSLLEIDESGQPVPALAESWTSEGAGVWLVRLRKNVKWHDGNQLFTSADVVQTVDTLVQLGSQSYYFWCAKRISLCEAVDEYTVRFTMTDGGVMSLAALSFPIIRADAASLVGTGAYRLLAVTDESISLTANERWWDKTPYITTITFYERDSNDTALASYEAGQLNFVPTDLLTAGKYSERGVTDVLDVMTQGMEVLLCNHNRTVMQSADMRLAIAHGINRSRIITNIYMNRARASDVPIPSDSRLYDSRCATINYDTSLSDSLLSALGYRYVGNDQTRSNNGTELRLTLLTNASTENTTRSDAASLIATQLAAIGIAVDIVTAEHTLGESSSPFIQALAAGDWDIALVGFNLCIDNDLAEYLLPSGACNYGGYSDTQMTTLVNNMRYADSDEALREAAYQLQLYFVQELPFITLYFRLNSIVYSARIGGVSTAREPYLMRGVKDWWTT